MLLATIGSTVILLGGDGRLGRVTHREYDYTTRDWYFHVLWDHGVQGCHHMTRLAPLLPVLGAGPGCTLRNLETL